MGFVDFWRMPAGEAERFLAAYVAEREARLDWFAWQSGMRPDGSRDGLVATWGWITSWWLQGGDEAEGPPYPIWHPTRSDPRYGGVGTGPALLMCDAAGFVWADHVLAELPAARWRRCDTDGLIFNHPVLQVPGGDPLCPFELAYSCMLALKDDLAERAGKPAGRDPEALAIWADGWIARARGAAGGDDEVGAQALSVEAPSST
ncbi:MAG TPA: hypothetical protein VL120_09620 [Solirubrobacteraceae bacterium]|nr:hypothetical protein [Solirubrobacteraceae bacterium]